MDEQPKWRRRGFDILLVGLFVWAAGSLPAFAQMGHVLDAVGPVNQSMGGAGTALPLDATGALHWNPASITGLEGSELSFAMTACAPSSTLYSKVDAGAFGPNFPPGEMKGWTTSDIDINPMPAFGFVINPKGSRWSYGLGGFAIAGFGVDYPASTTNPILTPQPPNGMGFGAVESSFQMMQIAPTVAYRLTDRTSIGIAPTFSWTSLGVVPFPGAPPDDANGDGFPTYPSGARQDSSWGLGFQIGYYFSDPCSGWNFGVAYKTAQWVDEYKINSQDELGFPRQITFDLDYPAIATMGVAYTGFDLWDFAVDLRYIDYDNTDGFRTAGFDSDGAVRGFGWQSIWAVAVGAQYHWSPTLKLRMGYTHNQLAVQDDVTFYNIHACGVIQDHLSGGFSWEAPTGWIFSFAYHYGFQNSISSPWQSPAGPIPGTLVRSTLQTHEMSGGISTRW